MGSALPSLAWVTGVAAVLVCVVIPARAGAQVTTRVSVATGGAQAAGPSDGPAPVSSDGRFVACSRVGDGKETHASGLPW